MKEKVKIATLLFSISILSAVNLTTGSIFKTTDTTTYDAVFSAKTLDNAKVETVSANTTEVNIPETTKTAAKSTKTAAKKTNTSAKNTSKHYDFTRAKYVTKKTGDCPETNKKGECVLNTPNTGIAQWRYCEYCKPFLYGHNTSTFSVLKYMKEGDTFTVKVDGKAKTYRVVKNFPLSNSDANNNNVEIYTSKYKGDYDITLQTCVGNSNATVRYIQAVAI